MKHQMTHGASELPDSASVEEAEKRASPPARLTVDEVSLSLSDYVSQVAAEEGLVFIPKRLVRVACRT